MDITFDQLQFHQPIIDHADALDWLSDRAQAKASVIVLDPPYAIGSPVRGREDGAAGSVSGPFSFMSRVMALSVAALKPGGICMMFADWRRMPDMLYIATTVGLRPSVCLAWVRKRPGTGGIFRSAWDPIQICARGVPDAVDRAAVRNVVETFDNETVIEADSSTRRSHPYEKPPQLFRHVFPRVCVAGDLVLDPFAGSGVSGRVAQELDLRWEGCDIDPAFATRTTNSEQIA
jgi:site-specific DNA-methyltransferase (adenine-specific)